MCVTATPFHFVLFRFVSHSIDSGMPATFVHVRARSSYYYSVSFHSISFRFVSRSIDSGMPRLSMGIAIPKDRHALKSFMNNGS